MIPGPSFSNTSPPPEATLTDASVLHACSSLSEMLSSAARSDGSIARLAANTTTASSRVVDAACTLINAVLQCVPAFTSSARLHLDAADKRLEMKAEELSDTVKVIQACLLQTYSADGSLSVPEDSFATVCRLFDSTAPLPDLSAMLTPAHSNVLRTVAGLSAIVTGIDPARCTVTHAPWLPRGISSSVTIALRDCIGHGVEGATLEDVIVTVGSGCVGWRGSCASVKGNMVTILVSLASDCSDTAKVFASFGSNTVSIPLQVPLPQ